MSVAGFRFAGEGEGGEPLPTPAVDAGPLCRPGMPGGGSVGPGAATRRRWPGRRPARRPPSAAVARRPPRGGAPAPRGTMAGGGAHPGTPRGRGSHVETVGLEQAICAGGEGHLPAEDMVR